MANAGSKGLMVKESAGVLCDVRQWREGRGRGRGRKHLMIGQPWVASTERGKQHAEG